jgi:hypothetical protein
MIAERSTMTTRFLVPWVVLLATITACNDNGGNEASTGVTS